MATEAVLIVNETDGELAPPAEFLNKLHGLERAVTRWDNAIAALKADVATKRSLICATP
jgi:hypothetical protein